MERLEELFALPVPAMREIVESFHREMESGLAGKESSLKMIPTYAAMPTGKEKGNLLALDLGGTNFRVLEITLNGDRTTGEPAIMKFALGKEHMAGDAAAFFDFIADSVKTFLKKYKVPSGNRTHLGFTFSFPIQQTGIAGGRLICWTKGFEVKGVVGNDVVGLMNEAFARKGIDNIRISALVNDTVGTLVAKSYEDPDCDVGVIIGTGTNACYPEKNGIIINIEWGNFNKLASTEYDKRLDEESDNPGQQILEKMVSGMYMGRIVQLILADVGQFPKKVPFETEYMSIIEGDQTSGLTVTAALLSRIGLPDSLPEDRAAIKEACGIVSRRAARISASCIAAIVTRMDPDLSKKHTIAIDGSVFEKHPTFARNMAEALKDLFGSKASRIKLALAKDGSGKGAAIIAAVAARG